MKKLRNLLIILSLIFSFFFISCGEMKSQYNNENITNEDVFFEQNPNEEPDFYYDESGKIIKECRYVNECWCVTYDCDYVECGWVYRCFIKQTDPLTGTI